jgi:hypothetical protein
MTIETADSSSTDQPAEESVEQEQLEIDQTEEHEYGFEDMLDEAVVGIEEDEQPAQPEVEPEYEPEPESGQPEEEPAPEAQLDEQALSPELEEQRKNMQADYTRKTQEIAELKKQTEPYAVLNAQLQNNPELLNQVIALVTKQNAPQQEQAPVAPEDPIEAIQFEAQQNAQKAIQEALAPVMQQQQAIAQQAAINQTLASVQQDPLFHDTHKAMAEYIQGDYANIHGQEAAKALYQIIDSDVNAFKQMYGSFRGRVEASKKVATPQTPLGHKQKQAPSIDPDTGVPAVPKQRQTRRKVSDMAKRAIDSGRIEDTMDYFEATGMFDKF